MRVLWIICPRELIRVAGISSSPSVWIGTAWHWSCTGAFFLLCTIFSLFLTDVFNTCSSVSNCQNRLGPNRIRSWDIVAKFWLSLFVPLGRRLVGSVQLINDSCILEALWVDKGSQNKSGPKHIRFLDTCAKYCLSRLAFLAWFLASFSFFYFWPIAVSLLRLPSLRLELHAHRIAWQCV